MECIVDTYGEEQMIKELEKQLNSTDQSDQKDTLTEDEKARLHKAIHEDKMMTGQDGEIHHIQEIDFIIKDILKHQHKAFKYERNTESEDEVVECQNGEENTWLHDQEFVRSESASLDYTNQQVINDQRGVSTYLIKKIGVNILSGKSIMNISLPIKLFEPHSMLEKIASSFRFSPYYLQKAKELSNPIDRVKVLVTGYIVSLQLEPQMLKPFNPILGETFQATIGDYEIVVEQISHHPPITAFEMWSDTLENSPHLSGYIEFECKTGLRVVTVSKQGMIKTYFPDNDQTIV